MGRIKFLVMDVDGTLTDGKIYMGQDGEFAKAFDIKDGCGLLLVLPEYSIKPVVITARKSVILENRCKEIGITELHQGVKDKLAILREIVSDDLSSVAYAGDDLPDLPCMNEVKKAGGVVLCPADAVPEIKAVADYVSGYRAGEGAIRDCINYLIQIDNKNIQIKIQRVINSILCGDYSGGFIEGNPYTIQEYQTKDETLCVLESHRKHIDVQYILEGHEGFKSYMTNGLTYTGLYNVVKDVDYWKDGIVSSYIVLAPGSLIVVHNGQPHKGAICCEKPEMVKKLVCKIEI